MSRFFLLLSLVATCVSLALAQQAQQASAGKISGKVYDASTGLPLVAANVIVEGTTQGTNTDQQGRFVLERLEPGRYKLIVSYVGYKRQTRSVEVGTSELWLEFGLVPTLISAQEVVVTALRAKEGETPVAFTNLSAETIREKNWGQEIPLLVNEVPGLYSYSQTGSGLGYSEVKIRGFDATRVAVTINNVPLNDPEDHTTYFYDLPDLTANVQDIQVQRGVGNSLYGAAAIGGSISILTQTAAESPAISLYSGFGSYNTQRLNFSFNSGIFGKQYSVYGRFSKLNSDGYRQDAWVKAWSTFLNASRYDRSMTTTFNVFTGPIRAHFAWLGITREDLQTNRRLNYDSPEFNGGHKDNVDDFLQTHYQLLNNWQINDKIGLQNTFFHVRGEGFFESFKANRKFSEYNLTPITRPDGSVINRTNLVRQKWVSKKQYGWIPRLTLEHGNGVLTAGGELSLYSSTHYGQIKWAQFLPEGVPPNHRYYEYNTDKVSGAVYVHEAFRFSDKLGLMADLQYQHHTYDFTQERIGAYADKGYNYTLNYNFLSPRVGAHYAVTPATNLFVNFSVARREPKDSDIYDADDPEVYPAFQRSGANINFDKPLIEPETLYDFELGLGFRKGNFEVKGNGYWMDFHNEIVPTGQVDEDGFIIFGNADRSVHRGVEITAAFKTNIGLTFSGNASFSDNKFLEYNELGYDENWNAVSFNRKNKTIAGFPNYLLNGRINYQLKNAEASLTLQRAGRQYLDNSQTKALSIDPYTVLNFSFRYNAGAVLGIQGLTFDAKVNNLLDELYETHGAVDAGTAYFVPAAERNIFVGTSIEF
ncbi:MAG: TonB-dependent receptor [candidate division KSB1 bacterium]|nr:TonB-dependent receptor [candidate division KSB1 bacterium]MDZ7302360.1 TonB-dependent receptor [candidate division KSB1 bacterium]MDZ7311212.1 TonB-dependent receptor [candidate division KSB1 bacterium]